MSDVKHGLTDKGRTGGGHQSRDWDLPSYRCKALECVCNAGGICFVPSRAGIGPDGRCVGFKKKEAKKEEHEGD